MLSRSFQTAQRSTNQLMITHASPVTDDSRDSEGTAARPAHAAANVPNSSLFTKLVNFDVSKLKQLITVLESLQKFQSTQKLPQMRTLGFVNQDKKKRDVKA